VKTLAVVLLLALLLAVTGCGREGDPIPDTHHWYHCEQGAHGEAAGYTTIVVATSNCVPVN
jgi:hypothetical protein